MTSHEARPSPIDAKLLATLEKAFSKHAGGASQIALADLQKALGLRSEYLARRVMQLFDTNGDGVISKEEFFIGVRSLVFGTDRDKLFFAFRLHDHDGDGFLDRYELLRMISMSLAESSIRERATQTAEQLVRAFMLKADRDGDGRVSFDDLLAVIGERPELLRKMTRNEAIWIAPNEELLVLYDEHSAGRKDPVAARSGYATLARSIVLALFFAANITLFAIFWIRDGMGPVGVEPLVRGGHALARCADLDGALILVPMMRRLLTRIRGTWLGRALPVDDAIDFHRIVGHTLFIVGVLHASAFVAARFVGHSHTAFLRVLRTVHGPTGLALLTVLIVMWFFSLRFIRRGKRFELFYFTHLLYVAWLILAVVHAQSFIYWAGVPILGFFIEQVIRLARRGPSTVIRSSQALRSGVTRLEMDRPSGFTFKPGDYCFLCIPAIAKHAWHPFTISSAPERDRLVFHIRSLGDWTNALRQQVEAEPDAADFVAYVDGPYGSPSGGIFESRYALLIGAGIGVTPFSSVLESIVMRAEHAKPLTLEKAHFYWLNSDQYAFEWFTELLTEIEQKDTKRLLDIHLCMTGARTGLTAMGLEIAREIMSADGRSDLITGLRTRTHVGPPDWDAMLSEVVKQHAPEQVHVFYCGPPDLEAKLRPICESHGLTFRAERF